MAKYLLALSLAFALLLAGCAGVLANNGNDAAGTGNNSVSVGNNTAGTNNLSTGAGNVTGNASAYPSGKGKVLVRVQDVVEGCGIEPPDGNTSACGVHSVSPHIGKVEVAVIDVTGIDVSSADARELAPKSSKLGMLDTDSNGELSFDLPTGVYYYLISTGNQGTFDGPIKLEAGKIVQVGVNFTIYVPGTRPY